MLVEPGVAGYEERQLCACAKCRSSSTFGEGTWVRPNTLGKHLGSGKRAQPRDFAVVGLHAPRQAWFIKIP